MKSYKGFDKDLKCRGFQYEIGEEYECEDAVTCETGFHACERPLDVFSYYPPASSRYCEVEQGGKTDANSDDSKIASTKIKIGTEIGIPGLVKAQIEYVKAHTTTEHTDPRAATAGDSGAATAGNRGAATAGDGGAATAGNSGAATAGDCGYALSGGRSACGEKGVAVVRGNEPKAKGGLGAVLVIIKTDDDGEIETVKTVTVDDEKVKVDTWYTIKGKRLVEVNE